MAKKAYIGVNNVARKIKKGYVGVENFTKRNLPAGYTQVEYIESTGSQYIDTGFKPKYNSRVVMDISGLGTSLGFLFGTRDVVLSTAAKQFVLYRNAETTIRSDYFGTNASLSISDASARTVIDKNASIVTLFGGTITNTAVSSGECSYPLYLFTINNAGAVHTTYGKFKLYSCQIYDNGTMVRDYVPCVNSAGTSGLYDLVNGVFYANAGTGSFSVGTSTIKGIARKIRKVYIGIGGVARPCWSGGELAYYGAIGSFNVVNHAAASNSKYAVFGGGWRSGAQNAVTAYDKVLTTVSPTALSASSHELAAANVGQYALFAGGRTSSNTSSQQNTVNAYDESLTRTMATNLSLARYLLRGATIGNYALFGGGRYGSTIASAVDVYDASLTLSTPNQIFRYTRHSLAAATVGGYVIFAGGNGSSSDYATNYTSAYDASLVLHSPPSLSVARYKLAAATVGDYALFAGGYPTTDTVDAYNASLTRTTPGGLDPARHFLAATSLGGYALFAGGTDPVGSAYDTVNVYDKSLTKTTANPLNAARSGLVAATIGDYAIFGGGIDDMDEWPEKTVDAYTIA